MACACADVFGSVSQWLGCLSLAGGLSLIYAWSMVDMWPLCGQVLRCGSTNHSNSAFHPPGVGKWIVTWIMGMETIKRRRPLIGFRSRVRGLGLIFRPIGYRLALSVTRKRRCSCILWCYVSVICLYLWSPPLGACTRHHTRCQRLSHHSAIWFCFNSVSSHSSFMSCFACRQPAADLQRFAAVSEL